ncbi:MAG: hypothetical protein HQK82_11930, partial [Desulfovibrionaceae bacterium]|nr:hypothetical protein [Desulfovibrionaceae bacterium]
LDQAEVDHGNPVSFLVSARDCLGMTGGWVDVGDDALRLRIAVPKSQAASVGLVSYRTFGDLFFFRLELTAGEVDETCLGEDRPPLPALSFSISPAP